MESYTSEALAGQAESRWTAFGRMAAGAVGLLLVIVVTAFLLQEKSGLERIRDVGTIQSDFSWEVSAAGDSVYVMSRIVAQDFEPDPVPAVGDTLIAISGELATTEQVRALFMKLEMPAETSATLTFRGENRTTETVIYFRPEQPRTYLMIVLIDMLRFVIAFAFLGVGLWAFFAQPNSHQVRVFAWFSFSMTGMMLSGVNVVDEGYSSFTIPYWTEIEQGLGFLSLGVATFWLHLQLVFPRPFAWYGRNAKWLLPVVYAPWLQFLLFTVLSATGVMNTDNNLLNFMAMLQAVVLLVGFVLLAWRYHKSVDRVESRQLGLVLWGTGVGLGGLLGLIILSVFIQDWLKLDPNRMLLLIVIGFLLLLLTPVTFAYAFTRYRLLEVQGKLKRGTRYLIAAVLAFTGLFAVLYFIGQYTLFGSGIANSPWAMLMVMLFALAAGRVSLRMNKVLEQQFFPERKQLREKLERAIDRTTAIGDSESFWSELGDRFRESLRIETIQPVLAVENGGQYLLPTREHTPFMNNSDFVLRLAQERRPVFVDEILASGRSVLSADEHRWLAGNNVAVVLPLVTQQRMAGFLALGYKSEKEDFAPEELTVLGNLAPQLAMASENLRLIEENVEKRRLEEQMQIARRIQEGFLPRELPQTIGLEVATHSRFSLEVAGDYFDVMTLPDGETVTAIADVSGKGAGAALLMANLQASLRTAVEAGIPLTKAIAQVNNLIFRNTPPEQYITFVAALFDPRTSKLRYVNAGHNPPIVVRADGSVEELPATGLILGAIPNMKYEEGETPFHPGDVLVLYTDGVSEAMNDYEVEYGEDRIRDFTIQHRMESPARLVALLEDDVECFCGRIPNEDDSTMVVVKRI